MLVGKEIDHQRSLQGRLLSPKALRTIPAMLWVLNRVTAYSLCQGLWFSSEPVTQSRAGSWDRYTEARTVCLSCSGVAHIDPLFVAGGRVV